MHFLEAIHEEVDGKDWDELPAGLSVCSHCLAVGFPESAAEPCTECEGAVHLVPRQVVQKMYSLVRAYDQVLAVLREENEEIVDSAIAFVRDVNEDVLDGLLEDDEWELYFEPEEEDPFATKGPLEAGFGGPTIGDA